LGTAGRWFESSCPDQQIQLVSTKHYRFLNWSLEQTHALRVQGADRLGNSRMLTILAMLAAPVLVATIVLIVIFEIKDAWDRNRLR
jgi:hypothetical protein